MYVLVIFINKGESLGAFVLLELIWELTVQIEMSPQSGPAFSWFLNTIFKVLADLIPAGDGFGTKQLQINEK